MSKTSVYTLVNGNMQSLIHRKQQKSWKGDITHHHIVTVNVLLNNITFLWFLLFSICQSLHVAVNKCINWCFGHLYLLFYCNNKVFMLMVNYKPSAFHGHEDTEPYIFWVHEFDLYGSRDVIGTWPSDSVMDTFLLVVIDEHASILHGYGDTRLQRF